MQAADLGDGGHDLRPDADAADGVVHRVLAVRHAEGRDLGAEPAAVAGDRLLPDRVGDAAPAAVGAGAAGRDRLSGTVEADETFIGGDEPGLRGGRARGKKVLTGIAGEVGAPKGIGRCRMEVLADASAESLNPVHHRRRRAGQHRDHRRLAGLQRPGRPGLHPRAPQPAGRARPRRGSGRAAARRAPGRLAGQAVAAGYSPGPGGRGSSAELPGRVRLPLQPPPLGEPRPGLLPGHGAGRLARPGQVPGPPRRQEAAPGPGSARLGTRAELGPPRSEPAMEDRRASAAAADSTPVK